MDMNSMKLNRTRNVFISPHSNAQSSTRRHSSVVHRHGTPQEKGSPQLELPPRTRKSWTTTGMNDIGSNNGLEAMTADELRQLVCKLTATMDDLQNDLRNATAENQNLKHQLQCRAAKLRQDEQMLSSSFRRSSSLRYSASIVPFECDESLVEPVDTAEETDDEIMFLVPEDLKQEEPSRISVFLSQSMTVLAHINNQEVIEKVCVGSQIAKQVAVGGIAGYFTSHLVRKFGKIAVGSVIGSLLFIKLAHHRGYIAVDWNRIQKQIENPIPAAGGDGDNNSGCPNNVGNDIAWLTNKYQQICHWSRENSYTVLGFWAGFLTHNFHN